MADFNPNDISAMVDDYLAEAPVSTEEAAFSPDEFLAEEADSPEVAAEAAPEPTTSLATKVKKGASAVGAAVTEGAENVVDGFQGIGNIAITGAGNSIFGKAGNGLLAAGFATVESARNKLQNVPDDQTWTDKVSQYYDAGQGGLDDKIKDSNEVVKGANTLTASVINALPVSKAFQAAGLGLKSAGLAFNLSRFMPANKFVAGALNVVSKASNMAGQGAVYAGTDAAVQNIGNEKQYSVIDSSIKGAFFGGALSLGGQTAVGLGKGVFRLGKAGYEKAVPQSVQGMLESKFDYMQKSARTAYDGYKNKFVDKGVNAKTIDKEFATELQKIGGSDVETLITKGKLYSNLVEEQRLVGKELKSAYRAASELSQDMPVPTYNVIDKTEEAILQKYGSGQDVLDALAKFKGNFSKATIDPNTGVPKNFSIEKYWTDLVTPLTSGRRSSGSTMDDEVANMAYNQLKGNLDDSVMLTKRMFAQKSEQARASVRNTQKVFSKEQEVSAIQGKYLVEMDQAKAVSEEAANVVKSKYEPLFTNLQDDLKGLQQLEAEGLKAVKASDPANNLLNKFMEKGGETYTQNLQKSLDNIKGLSQRYYRQESMKPVVRKMNVNEAPSSYINAMWAETFGKKGLTGNLEKAATGALVYANPVAGTGYVAAKAGFGALKYKMRNLALESSDASVAYAAERSAFLADTLENAGNNPVLQDMAASVTAMLSLTEMSDEEKTKKLDAYSSQAKLIVNPLNRTDESVQENLQEIMPLISQYAPDLKGPIEEALKWEEKAAMPLPQIMDSLSKIKELGPYIKPGLGWGGKVYDLNDKAMLQTQLDKFNASSGMSTADYRAISKDIQINGTIPNFDELQIKYGAK